jgi:hypothetical protein
MLHTRCCVSCFIAAMLFLCVSCEKVLEFDGEASDPYVALYSAVEADSTLSMRLTYSRFFLSTDSFRVVNNADIHMYRNGEEMQLGDNDSNFYHFYCRPQPGDTLSVAVNVPGYTRGTVTAGTRVPLAPTVEYTGCDVVTDDGHEVFYDIHLRLKDPKWHNYYSLKMLTLTQGHHARLGDYKYSGCQFECNDPLLTDMALPTSLEELDDDTFTELTFNDDDFDGKTFDFTIRCRQIPFGAPNDDNIPLYKVQLSAINEDLYRYTVTQQSSVNTTEVSRYLEEAVQVFSNVKNGMGVFGAKTTKQIAIPITARHANDKENKKHSNKGWQTTSRE